MEPLLYTDLVKAAQRRAEAGPTPPSALVAESWPVGKAYMVSLARVQPSRGKEKQHTLAPGQARPPGLR